MLTADLARSRTSDGEVTPLFIDPDDAGYRETASELIKLFETHVGEPKADLDAAIGLTTSSSMRSFTRWRARRSTLSDSNAEAVGDDDGGLGDDHEGDAVEQESVKVRASHCEA